MLKQLSSNLMKLGMAMAAAAAMASGSAASAACVSGANTVDYVYLTNTNNGDRVYYDISCEGNGSNELDVKIQQQKSGGGWDTLVHFELEAPSDSRSGSFVVQDFFGSTGELVRVRLGRKIGTKEICYDISYWE